jgi:cyanophycin synthetase
MLQISTRLIAEEAARRGWHVEPLDERFISTLAITTPDGRTHYFDSAQPPLNSGAGVIIADNKLATYLIAQKNDIPVAPFCMYESAHHERAVAFLHDQVASGYKIVVKPIDTNHGDGITVSVDSEASLKNALTHAGEFSKRILLQRQYTGVDYRVLVVDGKVVAAARRDAASVIGDGQHTIAELIGLKNADPARHAAHDGALSKIDETAAKRHLGIRYNDIPAKGDYVQVIGTANLSKGGDATDITDELHPSFAAAAERIAGALDMYLCGVDFLAADHTKPLRAENGILLEINATPGLRMHHFPSKGQARAVAAAILDGFQQKIR